MQKWRSSMAKCKNCRNLKYKDDGRERYAWCPLIGDNPSLEFDRYCGGYKKMTNADRIRSMDDAKLAEFLLKVNTAYAEPCMTGESDCVWEDYPTHDKGCKDCFLEWLKSEVGCK